jgi:hypothetical protein
LSQAEHGLKTFTKWKRDLASLKQALTNQDDVDLRIRLNNHLRSFIEKVEVFTVGFTKECGEEGDDGDDFGEVIDGLVDDEGRRSIGKKQLREFARYVLQRRMTKQGRFVRVHFKTRGKIDLVPPGSLASGFNYNPRTKTGTCQTPDIEQLWRDYLSEKTNIDV